MFIAIANIAISMAINHLLHFKNRIYPKLYAVFLNLARYLLD